MLQRATGPNDGNGKVPQRRILCGPHVKCRIPCTGHRRWGKRSAVVIRTAREAKTDGSSEAIQRLNMDGIESILCSGNSSRGRSCREREIGAGGACRRRDEKRESKCQRQEKQHEGSFEPGLKHRCSPSSFLPLVFREVTRLQHNNPCVLGTLSSNQNDPMRDFRSS